eukprot:TRINITY_DN49068_c0_g1_i1.p1 TRINITY_DN49068_c0_g1~~TRINITY_DN49068_c0_g1_i1.p1  ORF type:complete len:889 (+),score=104.74 TRINITY_DN49068_c0_g1_i1:122-2788(+)
MAVLVFVRMVALLPAPIYCVLPADKEHARCADTPNEFSQRALVLLQTGAEVGRRHQNPDQSASVIRRHRSRWRMKKAKEKKLPMEITDVLSGVPNFNTTAVYNVTDRIRRGGGFRAFRTALVIHLTMTLLILLAFGSLRKWYPKTFSFNTTNGVVPLWASPTDSNWSWIHASLSLRLNDIHRFVGLDMAMQVEFCQLAIRTLIVVGVPLVFILGPLHCLFGNNNRTRNGVLTNYGLGNVEDGSWLFWIHSLVVWLTVFAVQKLIFMSMSIYMKRRFTFLAEMPSPRSKTILVENISEHYCSDKMLKVFFERMFGEGSVESAFVVKRTEHLVNLIKRTQHDQLQLAEARITIQDDFARRGTISYFEKRIKARQLKIEKERARLQSEIKAQEESKCSQERAVAAHRKELRAQKAALSEKRARLISRRMASREEKGGVRTANDITGAHETDETASPGIATGYIYPGYESDHDLDVELDSHSVQKSQWIWRSSDYSTSGFVTFSRRVDSEMALIAALTSNRDEFVVSNPPDPNDVIYTDLMKHPQMIQVQETIGYVLLVGIIVCFLPVVATLSALANVEDMSNRGLPLAHFLETHCQTLCTLWDGLVATMSLDFFMSLFPNILVVISLRFFSLKAEAWLQSTVQVWFFWFLIIYVLLVTEIGVSIVRTGISLLEEPLNVVKYLADFLPEATNFFLIWVTLQWFQHAITLWRLPSLLNFIGWRVIYEEDVAREMSALEDQGYHGIGSRSARLTLTFVVCLVFSTLSPLITMLGLVNFFLCRLIYGYLTVFAESRKPDLGGVFFVQQLIHTQKSMFLYILLMVGVLLKRASNPLPGLIASGCVFYQFYSLRKFHTTFEWKCLPLEDIHNLDECVKQESSQDAYAQPELNSAAKP